MKLRQSTRPASASRGKWFMWTLGFVGIAIALGLLFIGYNAPNGIPGRSYYNVQAEFDDADNLTKSYQVRIGGRLVGQILDPRVEDGKGVVRMQLTPEIEPLLSDSTVRVRPRSAVGVRFVELTPGTRGTPLPENGRIPATQTSETVQLDEAFDALDAPRREKLQQFMSEMGTGFAGRGEDNNLSLRDAPDFLTDLESVAGAVNRLDDAPERFVAESRRAANAAAPVRDEIADGFAPESDALDIFTDAEDGLRDFLDTAPAALQRIQRGLAQTDPMLIELRGTSRELDAMLDSGVPALRNTSALLREARPGLRELPDTLGLAEDAVDPTLSVLDTIQPVLPNIDEAVTEPLGILDVLAPRSCDVLMFTTNWTSMLGFGGDAGSVLRFNLIGSQESGFGVTDATKRLGPPIQARPYPAPCSTSGGQR